MPSRLRLFTYINCTGDLTNRRDVQGVHDHLAVADRKMKWWRQCVLSGNLARGIRIVSVEVTVHDIKVKRSGAN